MKCPKCKKEINEIIEEQHKIFTINLISKKEKEIGERTIYRCPLCKRKIKFEVD